MTGTLVNNTLRAMVDLCVIDDPESASVALDPVRNRLLSELRTPASAAVGRGLATLSINAEDRIRSAEDRAAFSRELTAAVAALVSRYHDESAPGGRRHRLTVGAYPTPRIPHTPEVAKGKEATRA